MEVQIFGIRKSSDTRITISGMARALAYSFPATVKLVR
jgi:hypothetical protein